MPSIEQCDVASGSVAALPSTLEIFDKFKPIMDNGKDSDSEESFHLLLEDDDIENQSVTSEGKGKENHNEETEDEILNKFETLPSGTPDHIDPHIEDSILNDTDEDNVESNKENEPKTDENQENIQKNNDIIATTEVKITYKFEDYENSCDGEFKSIYETDADATKEETEKEEECDKASENVEPMEVSETLPDIDITKENEVEEAVDTFEDGMDMEQDDTNEDIANIIEQLEDQDTPMEEPEVESECVTTAEIDLTQNDILMAETSEITSEESKQLEPEQAQNVLDSDVEMTEEETLNTEIEEPHKENEQQEETSTFQDPTEESEDSKETHSETVEVQVPVNEENIEAAEESAPCVEEEEQQQNEDEPSKLEEPISEANKSTEGSEDLSLGIVDEEVQKQTPSIENQSNSVTEEPEQDLDEAPKESVASIEENNQVEEKEENSQVEEKEENNQVEEKEENNQVEEKEENNQVEEKEENNQVEEKEENNQVEEKEENNQVEEKEENNQVEEKEENNQVEENDENIQVEEKESEVKSTETDDDVFKVPEQPQKDTSDLTNDKPEEDEGDLLDISMVRETEEDDACAIADAIEDNTAMEDTDKETQASEKSDEEQSEKMETEQEGSDIDKDQDSNDGNDNAMGFDDMDDDSRIDADDNSSNAEAPEEPKDKIIEIYESSKDDDSSDNDSKAIKDVATEVENDLDNSTVDDTQLSDDKLVETKEAEEQDDIVIQDGIDSATKETEEQDDIIIQDGIDSATKETEEQDHIIIQDDIDSSDITDKTDEVSDKAKEMIEAPVEVRSEAVCEVLPEEESKDDDSDIRRSSLNKRSHSLSDSETVEVSAKKPKIDEEHAEKETEKLCDSSEAPITENLVDSTPAEKLKTLTAFSSFMKCRKLTAKLSRSDLEQFCIQKICESLMLKSSEGELHQTLKKHEKTIDNLRKDIQQLGKQCKDLEIVNKKLMNELRTQNVMKKPLVPLKITRSVGLQVRLNPGNEVPNQNRRRQPISNSPQKQPIASPNNNVNRGKTTPGGSAQQPSVVRQIMQASPQKPLTPTTGNNANAPMLSQALQKRPGSVVGKRTATPVRKPGNPGVIDLTDEDDKQGKAPGAGNPIKIINKTMPTAGATNKAIGVNKMGAGGKTVGKQVAVSKAIPVGPNKGNTLSQGIRLTPTSVISSSGSGSPQMVYVVPTITSNAGGQQKVAFVNFQPTNGVLSGTLNGSTVSVMPNKQGQTLTLKTLPGPMRNKHPAPLPTPPRVNLDPKLKPPLPKPLLTIKKIDTGIILQWKMPYNLDLYESIASYQLYAYQETSSPPNTDMWRKVGDVKALALPMACTLTQFADKNKYYFAVRSVDVHKRIGAFSDPEEISL